MLAALLSSASRRIPATRQSFVESISSPSSDLGRITKKIVEASTSSRFFLPNEDPQSRKRLEHCSSLIFHDAVPARGIIRVRLRLL